MCLTEQCCLEWACNWHEEADVATSVIAAEMLVAAWEYVCCPWYKLSQRMSEETSWFFIRWALPNGSSASPSWRTKSWCQFFCFSDRFFIPNSKCILILLKAVNCFAEWLPAGKINLTCFFFLLAVYIVVLDTKFRMKEQPW